MGLLDSIIFKDKKFSDLLEEIYDLQQQKNTQVTALIQELKPLVQEIGDATLIVPLIKEYLEISIKNKLSLIELYQMFSTMLPFSEDWFTLRNKLNNMRIIMCFKN